MLRHVIAVAALVAGVCTSQIVARASAGYYERIGSGPIQHVQGDPLKVEADHWIIYLYPPGVEANGGPGSWGLIYEDTAAKALAELDASQEAQRVYDHFFDIPINADANTFFNPFGPIAIIKPPLNHAQEVIDVFAQTSEIIQRLSETSDKMQRLVIEGKSSQPGSHFSEYLKKLHEAFANASELQRRLYDYTAPSMDTVTRAFASKQLASISADEASAEKGLSALATSQNPGTLPSSWTTFYSGPDDVTGSGVDTITDTYSYQLSGNNVLVTDNDHFTEGGGAASDSRRVLLIPTESKALYYSAPDEGLNIVLHCLNKACITVDSTEFYYMSSICHERLAGYTTIKFSSLADANGFIAMIRAANSPKAVASDPVDVDSDSCQLPGHG